MSFKGFVVSEYGWFMGFIASLGHLIEIINHLILFSKFLHFICSH